MKTIKTDELYEWLLRCGLSPEIIKKLPVENYSWISRKQARDRGRDLMALEQPEYGF